MALHTLTVELGEAWEAWANESRREGGWPIVEKG